MEDKLILDACCGSRMFWFDKQNKKVVFMDNRQINTTLCDGRELVVAPDIIGDFRNIPFPENTFSLVVFDPPHLLRAGEKSWLAKKYGVLSATWQSDITQGLKECFRVLKVGATLVFKWNEEQIKLNEILKLTPCQPLFGDKRSKTHWIVFIKEVS